MNLSDVDTMPWDREDEAVADAAAEDCAMCGGPLQLLGQLGNRIHLRCRNCGMDCSRLVPVKVAADRAEDTESPF